MLAVIKTRLALHNHNIKDFAISWLLIMKLPLTSYTERQQKRNKCSSGRN